MSYNTYSLIHVANDCTFQHGPLDFFSAYPFESYLGQLKSLLRGTRSPLAQLKKRLSEIDCHDCFTSDSEMSVNSYEFNIKCLKPNSKSDSFVIIHMYFYTSHMF